MKVKIMEYKMLNGLIQWQISTFIDLNVINDHIALALTVLEIFTFQISWRWKWRSKSWNTIFTMTSFDRKYIGNSNGWFCRTVECQNNHLKSFDLEILVYVTEYNIHNAPISWNISTSIKVIYEHFSLALTSSRYPHFKFRDVANVGQGHEIQHFAMAQFDGEYTGSYLMAIVMFTDLSPFTRYSQIK